MAKVEKLDIGPKAFTSQKLPEKALSVQNIPVNKVVNMQVSIESKNTITNTSMKKNSGNNDTKNNNKKKSSISYENDVCIQSNVKRVKFLIVELSGKLYLFDTGKIIFVRTRNNDQRKFDETNMLRIDIKNNIISIWINTEKRYQFKVIEGKIAEWENHIKRVFPKISIETHK